MGDLPVECGHRWHVESFFSGLKRTMLSTLSSRKREMLIAEASTKVLAYAVGRDEITAWQMVYTEQRDSHATNEIASGKQGLA